MKPKDSWAEQVRKRKEKQLRAKIKLLLKLEDYDNLHKVIKEREHGDIRLRRL